MGGTILETRNIAKGQRLTDDAYGIIRLMNTMNQRIDLSTLVEMTNGGEV